MSKTKGLKFLLEKQTEMLLGDATGRVKAIRFKDGSEIPADLLVMAVGFSLLFVTLHLAAMRNEILRRRVRSLQMMQASQQAA